MLKSFPANNVSATSELLIPERRVRIRIKPLPGFRYWSRPGNAALRSMADKTIEESAYPSFYRVGTLRVVDTDLGWNVFYETADATD